MGPVTTGEGRIGDFEERFGGDFWGVGGYGKGVCSFGGCVYAAR